MADNNLVINIQSSTVDIDQETGDRESTDLGEHDLGEAIELN